MKSRHLIPELMDDPHLDRQAHVQAMRGLQRLNRWSAGARPAWWPIRELARQLGRDRLRILDVATGAADVPIQLARRAQRSGIALELHACDVSPQALEIAAENCRRADVPIHLFRFDVTCDRIDNRYDLVMCSTFLHHLDEAGALNFLRKMRDATEHRIVVVDILRSRTNWCLIWLATRLLSRSTVVHFDGPQSVRAAFTVAEMRQIAAQAGIQDIRIRAAWPCRFLMVGRPCR